MAVLASSCGDGDSSAEAGDTTVSSTESGESTTDLGPGELESSTFADGEETQESGFDPPVPECGNGYVEGDEQCDDANDRDDDGCSSQCLVPCGLLWEATELPPTAASDITALYTRSDLEGNVFVLGHSRQTNVDKLGEETLEPRVIRLFKYGPDAKHQWDVTIGSSAEDGAAFPSGLALSDSGQVYVAATVDRAGGNTDIGVFELDGATGERGWSEQFDSAADTASDEANGIAVTPGGDVVVAGTVRVAAGDDDVWLARYDATGSPLWTTTWGGEIVSGFSVDAGGPVAVGPDDAVYVFARVYEGMGAVPGSVVKFGPDGGEPVWVHPPGGLLNTPTTTPLSLAVDGTGDVYAAFNQAIGTLFDFYVVKLDSEANELWRLSRADLAAEGDDWIMAQVALTRDDHIVIGGRYAVSDSGGGSWQQAWITRRDLSGVEACATLFQATTDELVPPSLIVEGVGANLDGGGVLVGQRLAEGDTTLWMGSFRSR